MIRKTLVALIVFVDVDVIMLIGASILFIRYPDIMRDQGVLVSSLIVVHGIACVAYVVAVGIAIRLVLREPETIARRVIWIGLFVFVGTITIPAYLYTVRQIPR